MKSVTPLPRPLAPQRLAQHLVGSSSASVMLRHPRGRLAPPLMTGAPRVKRLVRAVHRLAHGLALHDVLVAAPAMAFHFFLSLLPLLVFVGYVVGLIARRRGVDAVLAPLLESLPAGAEAVVKKEVERLAGAGGSALGPVAAISFLWIASGGIHGLMIALENVVGVLRRPWWKKRVLALLSVVALLSAFALASLALLQWDAVVHPHPVDRATATEFSRSVAPLLTQLPPSASASASASRRIHGGRGTATAEGAEAPPTAAISFPSTSVPASTESERHRRPRIFRSRFEHALALALSILAAISCLAGFYRLSITFTPRIKRRLFPGSALAVAVWVSVSWAFGLYVSTLAEYAVFYGSLAAVAVLLVWLWLTSFAILVGAEFNAQLEGLRD